MNKKEIQINKMEKWYNKYAKTWLTERDNMKDKSLGGEGCKLLKSAMK